MSGKPDHDARKGRTKPAQGDEASKKPGAKAPLSDDQMAKIQGGATISLDPKGSSDPTQDPTTTL